MENIDEPRCSKVSAVVREDTLLNSLEDLYSRVCKVEENLGINACDKNEKETVRPDKVRLAIETVNAIAEKIDLINLTTNRL